ncbi:uncharacterized protein LOC142140557 [Mixophyes fleayi]|uniref:uncharacterized protein LOC142140557 n=1 Tax=Mixophyes fleayi TaxID=3061075 RepID=UPI003F4E25F4
MGSDSRLKLRWNFLSCLKYRTFTTLRCVISDTLQSSGDSMAHVIVLLGIITGAVTVTIVQYPPILLLSAGQDARMSCNIKGSENVQIEYYYWHVTRSQQSTLLENNSRVGLTSNSLVISSVTPRDTGLYVCQLLNYKLDVFYGPGTNLLITATPVMSLRVDTEKNLLICEAERFYPHELEISWNNSTDGYQVLQTLTENEDGTYTKRSILKVTEELLGQKMTCHLWHITRNVTLHHYDPRLILYQQLFPVRILLVVILILSFVSCRVYLRVYHHLQLKASGKQ